MSISQIIKDEADQKRYQSLKEAGIKLSLPPTPQTMSLCELCHIVGMDDGLVKTNNHYPQIVDVDEF